MPFPYYDSLSRRDQATYRKSDSIGAVELPNLPALLPHVAAIEAGLEAVDRTAVGRAAKALLVEITAALQAPPVTVKVLTRRPSSASEELHGLYTPEDDGVAEIRVWMRTAANARPVRFRTFLRTLLHELCHHLDYEHHLLAESFHTEGFFRRESGLMRQLAPRSKPPKSNEPEPALAQVTARALSSRRKPGVVQLELPMVLKR